MALDYSILHSCIQKNEEMLAMHEQEMRGLKKAKKAMEEIEAKNQFTIMQSRSNKHMFDKVKEKIELQRRHLKDLVEDYKGNVKNMSKQEDNQLEYVANIKEEINQLLDECQKVVVQAREDDGKKQEIVDAASVDIHLRKIEPQLSDG